jgi:hypothetical protein
VGSQELRVAIFNQVLDTMTFHREISSSRAT